MNRYPETHGKQAGFAAIEIVVVIMIAAVLMGMAIPAFGRVQARRGVINARNTLIALAARARAHAVERGENVYLEIDPVTNRAWVRRGTDTIQVVQYSGEFAAEMQLASNTSTVAICYSSRGFARESCNAGTLPDVVTFRRGPETARARIRPLGQVESL